MPTVPRPDICARLAQTAARVESLRATDLYRIGDLIKTVNERQEAPILHYASSSHPSESAPGDADWEMWTRERKVHCGTMTFADRSDAYCGDQTEKGRFRLGFVIGLASSTVRGRCDPLQMASK